MYRMRLYALICERAIQISARIALIEISGTKGGSDDDRHREPDTAHRAPGVAGAASTLREDARRGSPHALRRRPAARRADGGGGRRHLLRLLQEPHHGRDDPTA